MYKMFDVDSVRELLGMPNTSAAQIPTSAPEPKPNPPNTSSRSLEHDWLFWSRKSRRDRRAGYGCRCRDREFESPLPQRRVRKLSVPLGDDVLVGCSSALPCSNKTRSHRAPAAC